MSFTRPSRCRCHACRRQMYRYQVHRVGYRWLCRDIADCLTAFARTPAMLAEEKRMYQKENEPYFCPKCKRGTDEDFTYCPHCGININKFIKKQNDKIGSQDAKLMYSNK